MKIFFTAAVNHDICGQDTSFRGKCKPNCASNAFQDQILFTTGRERGVTLTRAGSTEVAAARARQLNEGKADTGRHPSRARGKERRGKSAKTKRA